MDSRAIIKCLISGIMGFVCLSIEVFHVLGVSLMT